MQVQPGRRWSWATSPGKRREMTPDFLKAVAAQYEELSPH